MPSRLVNLLAVALTVALVWTLWLFARDPAPPTASGGASVPTPDDPPAVLDPVLVPPPRTDGIRTDGPVEQPLHLKSKLPPGTWIPVTDLPEVDHGIPLPDGRFLPLLNGMTDAPMLHRHRLQGPVPPIIAKAVDIEGFEWWVHSDGSYTTSKYQEVVLQDGTRYWDPAAFHGSPMDADTDVPVIPGRTGPGALNPDPGTPTGGDSTGK